MKTTESTINDVDLVVLATGHRFNLHRYRFLSNLIERHEIPTLCGLPQLDRELQLLPVQNLFGSGVIAQLQIGPAAGNIAGVTLAYERMREKSAGCDPEAVSGVLEAAMLVNHLQIPQQNRPL